MTSDIARGSMAVLLWWLLATTASAATPRPGDRPPDALGQARDGTPVTISQHRGKRVIVTFWASWCGPCRRELPILGHLQKVVGRQHLEVIAVNWKEPRQDFIGLIRANPKQQFTCVHDKTGEVADRYGIKSAPHMFVIDQDGSVACVHRGYSAEMLDGFVQEILALLPEEVPWQPAGA